MTTLQKALVAAVVAAVVVAAVVVAAVGTGIYETHRAATLQEQTAALQNERDAITAQLQQERDDSARKLAAQRRSASPVSSETVEIAKLRGQVDRLRDQLAMAKSDEQSPVTAQMTAWLDRVKKLKDKIAQSPDSSLPEFRYLTEQDWLDAVKDLKQLETQADYDKAVQALQRAARSEFSGAVESALRAYVQANNNTLPSDFSQLQPYFDQAPDDSVLQGYSFSQPGTVISKSSSLIDSTGNYYSYLLKIGMDGVSSTSYDEDGLHQAIQSYLAANNGQPLTDPSQLLPYVTTPEEKTTLQKVIQSNKPQ